VGITDRKNNRVVNFSQKRCVYNKSVAFYTKLCI